MYHKDILRSVEFPYNYGIYKISGDGLEFLKALKKTYYESPTGLLTQFEKLQSRKISDPFLHRFRV